ncbi:phosphatidylinositol 3,4,5-trisphosphate 3-phosphatase TPTE2-like isoform X1 [Lampetra planeri]
MDPVVSFDGSKVELCDGAAKGAQTALENGNAFSMDTASGRARAAMEPVVMSLWLRALSLLLIFVDLALVVADLSTPAKPAVASRALSASSLAISVFFFVDVALRVFVSGFRSYFRERLNIADAGIVMITLIVSIVYTSIDLSGTALLPRLVSVLRVLRLIMIIRVWRLVSQRHHLEKASRQMVSQNKRRYRKDGFDLDLTYVTERVIAMSFPSSGTQSMYRNPIKEVQRFLNSKHMDHYKVYNLCSEKGYDAKYFHYRVDRVFIDDHNVPSLADMVRFTASVRDWMAQDPKNIIAVHCKGGKGRTGTMICTWLIDSDEFEGAQASLDYFGERRTDRTKSVKFQGVETPSQVYTNTEAATWDTTRPSRGSTTGSCPPRRDSSSRPSSSRPYKVGCAAEPRDERWTDKALRPDTRGRSVCVRDPCHCPLALPPPPHTTHARRGRLGQRQRPQCGGHRGQEDGAARRLRNDAALQAVPRCGEGRGADRTRPAAARERGRQS